MRQAIIHRIPLPGGPARPHQQRCSTVYRRSTLVHRQARRVLARLLEFIAEPAQVAWLQPHVEQCTRCQQALEELRQAETWFLAQPVEVPQMVAAQGAVWSAIQTQITAG